MKYTIAFDGLTACDFKIFDDPAYTDENPAIPEVVLLNAPKEGSTTPNLQSFRG